MPSLTDLSLSFPRSSWWSCKPATPTLKRISGLSSFRPSLNGSSSLCGLSSVRGLPRYRFSMRIFDQSSCTVSYKFQIDRHALYILGNSTYRSRLSLSEIQYANAHQSILHAHYHASFLSQFPTSLQRMDDTAGGISMIEIPDVDKAVFVRALRDIDTPIFVEGTDMGFQMLKGDIYVVRWSAIRQLVLSGDAELI